MVCIPGSHQDVFHLLHVTTPSILHQIPSQQRARGHPLSDSGHQRQDERAQHHLSGHRRCAEDLAQVAADAEADYAASHLFRAGHHEFVDDCAAPVPVDPDLVFEPFDPTTEEAVEVDVGKRGVQEDSRGTRERRVSTLHRSACPSAHLSYVLASQCSRQRKSRCGAARSA